MKIRIASALTKPVMTERDTYCISRSSFRKPATPWISPMRMVAAKRYWTPRVAAERPAGTKHAKDARARGGGGGRRRRAGGGRRGGGGGGRGKKTTGPRVCCFFFSPAPRPATTTA